MNARTRRIIDALLEELGSMSNYEVEILLHCKWDEGVRADRFDAEDRLGEVLEREMES